ncbi:right-handed parallel beta-helix repeat-containing protein, partial [bacterium]|nr:right-handed parallel beta-helix repeat-containing protein [candidate division CSSED10-310 bacterium]
PTVTGCTFSDNTGHGIQVVNGSAPEIDSSSIESNGNYGLHVSGASNPVVTNSTFESNGSYGVYVATPDCAPVVTGNSFNANNSYPVTCYARHINNIYDNTYDGNLYQKVNVYGDHIAVDCRWRSCPVPYLINGNVTVAGTGGSPATLTIDAGTVMQFNRYYHLMIGYNVDWQPGALLVNGTDDDPVIFTYNDANYPPLSTGEWDGIYFDNYAVDALCRLDYAVIEYGGYDSNEGIYCNAASPQINHSTIRNCSGAGIYCTNAASPMIISCTLQSNTQYGIYATGADTTPTISQCVLSNQLYGVYITDSALPVIGGTIDDANQFVGNTLYGVYNAFTSTCPDAQYNFWGDVNGPYDSSAASDDCVNGGNDNPAGDRVSDDVYYLNWLPLDTPTPTVTPTVTMTPTPAPVPAMGTTGLLALVLGLSGMLACRRHLGGRR